MDAHHCSPDYQCHASSIPPCQISTHRKQVFDNPHLTAGSNPYLHCTEQKKSTPINYQSISFASTPTSTSNIIAITLLGTAPIHFSANVPDEKDTSWAYRSIERSTSFAVNLEIQFIQHQDWNTATCSSTTPTTQ